jgi:hypothetical protein
MIAMTRRLRERTRIIVLRKRRRRRRCYILMTLW